MKIIGIGTDIEEISRFKKLPFEKNKAFYNKIFTNDEIQYCLKKRNYGQHFTARFCAKEAFIKATKLSNIEYKSIEITFKDNCPTIIWKNMDIFLSLSHEKDKAIAFVIATQKNEIN